MVETYTIPAGGNVFCGPSALAYVMRSTPDLAAKEFRAVTGKRSIHGVRTIDMLTTLQKLGVYQGHANTAGATIMGKKPTLRAWVDEFMDYKSMFVVNITRHYIIIHGDRYYDNKCREGKPLSQCPYLLKRVKTAWKVEWKKKRGRKTQEAA